MGPHSIRNIRQNMQSRAVFDIANFENVPDTCHGMLEYLVLFVSRTCYYFQDCRMILDGDERYVVMFGDYIRNAPDYVTFRYVIENVLNDIVSRNNMFCSCYPVRHRNTIGLCLNVKHLDHISTLRDRIDTNRSIARLIRNHDLTPGSFTECE